MNTSIIFHQWGPKHKDTHVVFKFNSSLYKGVKSAFVSWKNEGTLNNFVLEITV